VTACQDIRAGERVALLAARSGKTTFVKLVQRFTMSPAAAS
jgi:ABC-type multidrug transport system fused ATPase/permease subunit